MQQRILPSMKVRETVQLGGNTNVKVKSCYKIKSIPLSPRPRGKTNSLALVRERTIPTERPPLVGEVSANFCG
jgi:hypothetical protein